LFEAAKCRFFLFRQCCTNQVVDFRFVGMDAEVAYAFHSERQNHPEKFKNQFTNQVRNIFLCPLFSLKTTGPFMLFQISFILSSDLAQCRTWLDFLIILFVSLQSQYAKLTCMQGWFCVPCIHYNSRYELVYIAVLCMECLIILLSRKMEG